MRSVKYKNEDNTGLRLPQNNYHHIYRCVSWYLITRHSK